MFRGFFYFGFVVLALVLGSCHVRGFNEPGTLNLEIPQGSDPYRAGWRAGCRSGIGSNPAFTNGFVYDPDHGSGVYQHEPDFYAAWSHGWFACVIHDGTFVKFHPMQYGPLQ